MNHSCQHQVHLDMHLNFVPIHAYYSKNYKVIYLVVEFFLDSTVVQMITKCCQVLKSIHVPTSIHWCMISRAARNVKFGNTLFYLLLEFFYGERRTHEILSNLFFQGPLSDCLPTQILYYASI